MPDYELKMKKLYKEKGAKFPAPIVNLTWDYGKKDKDGRIEKVDTHMIAREITGYYLEDVYDKKADPPKLLGKKCELCATFAHLQDDGTTSCGNWIYSQSYTQKGRLHHVAEEPQSLSPRLPRDARQPSCERACPCREANLAPALIAGHRAGPIAIMNCAVRV